MDIGFALDNHIDWTKGVFRDKYPSKKIVESEIEFEEFDDLIGRKYERSVKRVVTGGKLPPHPERDILWFLINYAPMESWEKDVLEIIREESYYFYPIVMTKIMNEGFASFWHAEIMFKYSGSTDAEHIEFCKCHSGVIQPGSKFSTNPYYIGFRIFTDIRKKWDAKYEAGESDIDGIQKVIEVAAIEDDASFLRNYLTQELAADMGLFNYGYKLDRDPDMDDEDLNEEHGIIELKDRDLMKVIENIIKPTFNYGAPYITIDEIDGDVLILKHTDKEGFLDEKYTEKTMEFIYDLWGGPVELSTYEPGQKDEEIIYSFDEGGFEIV